MFGKPDECSPCGGTGKVIGPTKLNPLTFSNIPEGRWYGLGGPCPTCHGTGKREEAGK